MKAVFQFMTKASAAYLMLFFLFLTMPLSAQDEEYEDEYYDDDEYYEYYDEIDYFPTSAGLVLAGYGSDGGLMLGLGYRWTNFSAQLSICF